MAFNVGGIPDMIEHKVNGHLANYKSSDDLAQGIKWVLDDKNRWLRLSEAACQKAERAYSIEVQARSYKALYEEILSSPYPA